MIVKKFQAPTENEAILKAKDVFGYEATEPQYETDYDLFHLTCGDHKEKTSKEYLEFLKRTL